MAVSYFDEGAVASPSGSVSSVTVAWPASVVEGQTAILVVSLQGGAFGSSANAEVPLGWQQVQQAYNYYARLQVFWGQVAEDSPASVVVPVQRGWLSSSNVQAQIFVFDNALRVSRRGRGVSIAADGAAAWAGNVSYSGSGLTIVDSLAGLDFGYKTSAAGEYFNPSGFTPTLEIGMELEPRLGPDAPTVLVPSATGEVATSSSVNFSWLHNGFDVQAQFELRVRAVNTSTWYYVKSDATLTTTPTQVTTSQQSIAVAASEFTVDTPYEWQVRTADPGPKWSPYTAVRTFSTVTPPTVTVTAPSSSITDDLSPTVTWSALSGARLQIAFRVTATDSTGYVVFDSGTILGNQTSYTLPPQSDFTNGNTVTFSVTLTQTGGAAGTGTIAQTVSWTGPDDPTIAVAADAVGVKVTIGSDTDTVLELERSTDGSNWSPVLSGLLVSPGTSEDVHDVLAPYDVAVTYRVRAGKDLDNILLTSDWVTSSSVTSTDATFYLVDAANPLTYISPIQRTDTNRRFVRGGSVSYPLGGYATVDYGPLQGDAGEFIATTETQSEAAAMKSMLTINRPVWIRWCPDSGVDVAATLVAISPDPIGHERSYQYALPLRDWMVAWTELLETP